MPARRLTTVLAAVLAIAGLSALPSAAPALPAAPAAQPVFDAPALTDPAQADGDDGSGGYDPSSDLSDEDLANQQDPSGDACVVDDGSTGEPDPGPGPDDPAPADDDPYSGSSADDPYAGDSTGTDSGSTGDPCAETLAGEDVGFDEIDAQDVRNLSRKGWFTERIDMPGPGTIDESLTTGSAGRAVAATVRVLGAGRARATKAGTVTVKVRLNAYGRRAVRTAKHALRLTLRTSVVLASGKTIPRTKALTVKPKKPKPGKRPTKPQRHKSG
jgi:hypothetical protein